MQNKNYAQTGSEPALRGAACSPSYPKNVTAFINKWRPCEEARKKAFWKEFRKAANAYASTKLIGSTNSEKTIDAAWDGIPTDVRYEMCKDSFSIGFRLGANSILENDQVQLPPRTGNTSRKGSVGG